MTTDNSSISLNICSEPAPVKKPKKDRKLRRKPLVKNVKNKVDLLSRPSFTFTWDNPKTTKSSATFINVKDDSTGSSLKFPSKKDIHKYVARTAAGIPSSAKDKTKNFKKPSEEKNSHNTTSETQQIDLTESPKVAVKNKFDKKGNKGPRLGKISSLFGSVPDAPKIQSRLIKPHTEKLFTGEKFSELSIHPHTVSNLEQNMQMTILTNVQKVAIPVLIEGKDALIRSQTGSGKTLAYTLPIIEALQAIRPKITRSDGVKALIIVPTRELALQTYELLLKLIKPFTWIVPGYLVGGEKRKSEKARLRRGINVLVGTPGRLLDHIEHTNSLKLGGVRFLVLDEADRMLDMGYEKDIRSLLFSIESHKKNATYDPMSLLKTITQSKDTSEEEPTHKIEKVQTVLLSATLTHAVETLAGLTLNEPTFIDTSDPTVNKNNKITNMVTTEDLLVIPESVVQSYVLSPPKLRLVTLSNVIVENAVKYRKMLVFMATQDMVDFHTELLSSVLVKCEKDVVESDEEEGEEEGSDGESGKEGRKKESENSSDYGSDEDGDTVNLDVDFFKLHGSMTQKERTDVFKTFRAAKSGVLFCTDVASRGLDVPRVECVVQYTAPTSCADYVHRVGRVGRAGASGTASLILSPPELAFVTCLQDKRIRLKENQLDLECLKTVIEDASSWQAAATGLQQKYENAVLSSSRLKELARKAYLSWVRFYATYPKDVRQFFNMQDVHLGHYAKSFALRDPPSSLGKVNGVKNMNKTRGNFKQRQTGRRPTKGNFVNRPQVSRNKRLVVSEFESGLEPLKKKKKKN